MQNIKSDNSMTDDDGSMTQNAHPMLDRPLFYLPQFPQAVPVPVPIQIQLPNPPQPIRNVPSATINANRRCDICNKVFSTPGNCSIHKKKHSADHEKAQCDECGKNFSTPGNLAIHKRIHTGEKAVRCDVSMTVSCMSVCRNIHHVNRNAWLFLRIGVRQGVSTFGQFNGAQTNSFGREVRQMRHLRQNILTFRQSDDSYAQAHIREAV